MRQSAGPGSPINFQCSKYRREKRWASRYDNPLYKYYNERGRVDRVVLTGRTRQHQHNRGLRHGLTMFEYRCKDCGHLGLCLINPCCLFNVSPA